MVVTEDLILSEDSKLTDALGQKEFLQITGFKDYLAFSNFKYPETKGQVILLRDDSVI